MAETSIQSNNRAVTFRGKGEREMSMEPKPKMVDGHVPKTKPLPKHTRKAAKHAAKRGMISDKQMAKLEG